MSSFLQSQGTARGGMYFGDPTAEFRIIYKVWDNSVLKTQLNQKATDSALNIKQDR